MTSIWNLLFGGYPGDQWAGNFPPWAQNSLEQQMAAYASSTYANRPLGHSVPNISAEELRRQKEDADRRAAEAIAAPMVAGLLREELRKDAIEFPVIPNQR